MIRKLADEDKNSKGMGRTYRFRNQKSKLHSRKMVAGPDGSFSLSLSHHSFPPPFACYALGSDVHPNGERCDYQDSPETSPERDTPRNCRLGKPLTGSKLQGIKQCAGA